MFYFVIVFSLIFFEKRSYPFFHSLLLSLLAFPAVYYLFSLAGVPVVSHIVLDVIAALLLAGYIICRTYQFAVKMKSEWKEHLPDLLIPALSVGLIAFLLKNTFILPVYDPVTVPSLAKIIFNAGTIPETLSPYSDDPFTYPPGYPVFISIFYTFNSPLFVLMVFKWINILVLSLTPAVWAYYFRKVYKFDFIKSYLVLIAFYYGFYFFDRTLILSVIYAGRNAMLFCAFLFPAVFFAMLHDRETWVDDIILTFAVLGGILIHFSFIFMFSGLLFTHLTLHYRNYTKNDILQCVYPYKNYTKTDLLKCVYPFIIACILFVPLFLSFHNSQNPHQHVTQDPNMQAHSYSFLKSCSNLCRHLFTTDNEIFWNFKGVGVEWKHKKILVLVFFLVPFFFALISRRKTKDPPEVSTERQYIHNNIFIAVLIFAMMILICVFWASGIIPKTGLNPDIVRWFAYNFYTLLFAVFFIFLCSLISMLKNRMLKKFFTGSIIIVIPFLFFLCCNDFNKLYKSVTRSRITYNEMKDLRNMLTSLISDRDCSLITESSLIWWNEKKAIHKYRPLEYYAVLSDLKILNGSWISTPIQGSREVEGLPSEQFYKDSSVENFYYVGSKETMQKYLAQVKSIRVMHIGDMGWKKIDGQYIFKLMYTL